MKALIGTKLGMTQIISEEGKVTPVTLVQAGPMTVVGHKTEDRDGYTAVAIGTGEAKKANVNKAQAGAMKDLKAIPKTIREIRIEESELQDNEALQKGASFDVSVFEEGDKVAVTGKSKGKGFAGTVKRHNFNTSAKSHGGNGVVRKGGSIGSMYPQKVYKGRKMGGQMGAERVTVKNLKVALINVEENIIGLMGAVPGPKRGTVLIKSVDLRKPVKSTKTPAKATA